MSRMSELHRQRTEDAERGFRPADEIADALYWPAEPDEHDTTVHICVECGEVIPRAELVHCNNVGPVHEGRCEERAKRKDAWPGAVASRPAWITETE